MKLSYICATITSSLIVPTKAVDGDCKPSETITQLGQADTYCTLFNEDPAQANLFEIVVKKGFEADSSTGFLQHCLTDVLLGSKYVESQGFLYEKTPCGEDEKNTTYVSNWVCSENTTKITTYASMEKDYPTNDVTKKTINDWNLLICKKDTCDINILQQVLTETYMDFLEIGPTKGAARKNNYTTTAVHTPTVKCFYDQMRDPIEDPELYCSGDDAPVCKNTKLIEITIDNAAPFEVAICDDNDCFNSLGDTNTTLKLAGAFAVGFAEGYNAFCFKEGNTFQKRMKDVNAVFVTDKVFNLKEYCSVEAVSGRTGICEPPPERCSTGFSASQLSGLVAAIYGIATFLTYN